MQPQVENNVKIRTDSVACYGESMQTQRQTKVVQRMQEKPDKVIIDANHKQARLFEGQVGPRMIKFLSPSFFV